MVVLPNFCPKCGIVMNDRDIHDDPAERWLRCGLCGYCEKVDPETYKDILNRNKKSLPIRSYVEDSRKNKK